MAAELILVDAEACRPLRSQILRPGRPAEENVYPLDDDPRAVHFAMKRGKAVLGVGSVFPDPRPDGPEQWRIRGMAVLDEERGKGLGAILLKGLLAIAGNRGGGLWCHARTDVEPFYARFGLVRDGDEFDLPGIGRHVVMTWQAPDMPRPDAEGAEDD